MTYLWPNKSPEPTAVGAAVPLSRFTPQVGGGSAFFVRPQDAFMKTMRDGKSAGSGSQFLFILLGLAGLVINTIAILFVSFLVLGSPQADAIDAGRSSVASASSVASTRQTRGVSC